MTQDQRLASDSALTILLATHAIEHGFQMATWDSVNYKAIVYNIMINELYEDTKRKAEKRVEWRMLSLE